MKRLNYLFYRSILRRKFCLYRLRSLCKRQAQQQRCPNQFAFQSEKVSEFGTWGTNLIAW